MPTKTYVGVNLTLEWDTVAQRDDEDDPEGSAAPVPCRFSINGAAISCSYLSLTLARFLENHQSKEAS